MSISSPLQTQPPTNIGAGLRASSYAASFAGTASTLNLQIPVANVVDVHVMGVPLQITTGTTLDRIVLNNSVNETTGLLTLLTNSTNQPYVSLPNVIQFARGGTNNQNIQVTVLSKG